MKKNYSSLLFFCAFAICTTLRAQIRLTTANDSYAQNFDGMGPSGTTLPTGWNAIRYAGSGTANATLTPAVTDGSANSGNVYNTGTTGDADRALGTLASGSTAPAFGVAFTNNTGSIIRDFSINAYCEQWRTGSNATVETVIFEYSTNATSLNSGTWTAVSGLNLNEILTADNSNTSVNGNLPANRATITGMLSAVNLPANGTIWLRWRDADNTGSDGLYALDDFQASWTNVAIANNVSVAAGSNVAEPSTNSTFTVSLNNPAPAGGVTVDYTLTGTAILGTDYANPQNGSVTIAEGNTSATVDINVTDDNLVEPTESITITLNSATNGYSIAAGSASLSLLDNESTTVFSAEFSSCNGSLSDGFTQQSVTGTTEFWKCSAFGQLGNGVEMNGYNNGNKDNEDWLVSPALDLTGTTYPKLMFSSISKFAGDPLRLFVTTNYTGDVTTTTWTELNGFFPAVNSNVWTLSDNIDLSAFKQANVRFALKYTSSTAAASRWDLDNIYVLNSFTPTQIVFNVSQQLLDFHQVASGNTSTAKAFIFTLANGSSSVTLTAPDAYELSKDGTTYASSLTYSASEAGNPNTVYVRLTTQLPNTTYAGYLQFSTTGFNQQAVFVKGNSYVSSSTLKIVNWNMEWFGSTASGQGPDDDNLAQANAKKVMDYLDADVYAVEEVVDVTRFSNLVASLNSPYGFVVSEHCSLGTTPAACATSQKLGFIYKTSVVSNVTGRALMITSPNAPGNWASGRVPFLVTATVTKNGHSIPMNFVVVHAKANTGTTQQQIDAYLSRKAGVQELKDTLDTYFANAYVVILGDYNDNLLGTIAPTTGADTVSSYQVLVADSTDANSYKSLTLPLSYFKQASTADNPGMIDHVIVSNELAPFYANLTSTLYNDIDVLAGIANYSTTTSDHFPVMTQYLFSGTLPVKLMSFTATKNGASVRLNWTTAEEKNTKEFVVERSLDGRNFQPLTTMETKGNSSTPVNYTAVDAKPNQGNNYYRLKTIDADGKSELSNVVKINFTKDFAVSLSPNPANSYVLINLTGVQQTVKVQMVNAAGKLIKTVTLTNGANRVAVSDLAKGLYLVKFLGLGEGYTEKLIVQ